MVLFISVPLVTCSFITKAKNRTAIPVPLFSQKHRNRGHPSDNLNAIRGSLYRNDLPGVWRLNGKVYPVALTSTSTKE